MKVKLLFIKKYYSNPKQIITSVYEDCVHLGNIIEDCEENKIDIKIADSVISKEKEIICSNYIFAKQVFINKITAYTEKCLDKNITVLTKTIDVNMDNDWN